MVCSIRRQPPPACEYASRNGCPVRAGSGEPCKWTRNDRFRQARRNLQPRRTRQEFQAGGPSVPFQLFACIWRAPAGVGHARRPQPPAAPASARICQTRCQNMPNGPSGNQWVRDYPVPPHAKRYSGCCCRIWHEVAQFGISWHWKEQVSWSSSLPFGGERMGPVISL